MRRDKVFVGVMGVTGAGKSTFIKAATDDERVVVGHELTSCTTSVCPYTFSLGGKEVVLIDTPGFNDTFKSEAEVLKEIASFLEKSYRDKDIKLSGIIYMHALEDRRMSGSSLRNLKMFRQLCGEQSMQNVILVSSGWDLIQMTGQEHQGEAKEAELKSNKDFWQAMISKGARVARFLNTKESAHSVISKLIPDPPIVLQIQHELVEDGKDLADTAAGVTVNEELAKLQAKYEYQLKEIREDMTAALKDKDEEMRGILDEERAKLERLRDEARRAQDSLRYAQRNAQRQHESELQDLRLALEDSRNESMSQREKDQRALMELQASKIADKLELNELVAQLRKQMQTLRREEQTAIETEIVQAEQELAAEEAALKPQKPNLDQKAKLAKKAKRKKRAFKLAMNVAGVVGSVTMSALGLGFLSGPVQGLIDFNGSKDEQAPAGDEPPAYEG